MESQLYSLKDILYGSVAVITIAGAIGGLYHLWLSSKLKNIPKLWEAKDALVDAVADAKAEMAALVAELRIELAKEYARKDEVAKDLDDIKNELRDLNKKMDRFLNRND